MRRVRPNRTHLGAIARDTLVARQRQQRKSHFLRRGAGRFHFFLGERAHDRADFPDGAEFAHRVRGAFGLAAAVAHQHAQPRSVRSRRRSCRRRAARRATRLLRRGRADRKAERRRRYCPSRSRRDARSRRPRPGRAAAAAATSGRPVRRHPIAAASAGAPVAATRRRGAAAARPRRARATPPSCSPRAATARRRAATVPSRARGARGARPPSPARRPRAARSPRRSPCRSSRLRPRPSPSCAVARSHSSCAAVSLRSCARFGEQLVRAAAFVVAQQRRLDPPRDLPGLFLLAARRQDVGEFEARRVRAILLRRACATRCADAARPAATCRPSPRGARAAPRRRRRGSSRDSGRRTTRAARARAWDCVSPSRSRSGTRASRRR